MGGGAERGEEELITQQFLPLPHSHVPAMHIIHSVDCVTRAYKMECVALLVGAGRSFIYVDLQLKY